MISKTTIAKRIITLAIALEKIQISIPLDSYPELNYQLDVASLALSEAIAQVTVERKGNT